MPRSARQPRSATKPSGRPEGEQGRDHADQPQRCHGEDDEQPAEALELEHQHGEHDQQHHRHHGHHRGLGVRRSPRPCRRSRRYSPAAGPAGTSRSRPRARPRPSAGSLPGITSAWTVRVGTRSRRQISGKSWVYSNDANWLSGTVRPLGSGTCRVGRVVSDDALLVGGAGEHVDEVDVVADLGHRRAGDHRVEHARPRPRSSGRAGAPRSGRCGCAPRASARPSRSWSRSVSGLAATTCARSSAIARTTDGSGPLTRYWIGQPTGGPSSSGETRATTSGNSSASLCSSLPCRRSRAVDVLGDDHRLGEERVGQLHVERQVEADRPLADIGAPALDVGIALEHARRSASRQRVARRRSRRSAAG